MSKIYEIHDLTTAEILADELTFEDVPELFLAYNNFYPDHDIIVCYREFGKSFRVLTPKRLSFAKEWYNLIEENIYNIY